MDTGGDDTNNSPQRRVALKHLRSCHPRFLLFLFASLFVAACGGGGGGGGTNPPPADTTPPTVASTSPAAGATGVSVGTTIRANLSEALSAASVGAGALTVSGNGTNVAGTVTLSGNAVVFTPSAPLAVSTQYTAVLSNAVTDLAGNRLASNFTWSFTTAAGSVPPTVTALNPADNATGVSVNTTVSATLSEALDPNSVAAGALSLSTGGQAIAGSVSLVNSNRTVLFTPNAPLNGGVTYTATLSGSVEDLDGNALGADTTWTFATLVGGGAQAGPASIVYASFEATTVLRQAAIDQLVVQDRNQLSDPAWFNTGFLSFELSPDGSSVAAIAAATNVSDVGLYVIPTAGGAPVKVAGDGSFGIRDLAWSPDGSWLAYAADKDVAGKTELYVVSATGTGDTKVSGTLPDTADVLNDYQWSADSAFVAYRAAQDTANVPELYVSARDGSSNVKVSGQAPATAGQNVAFGWQWSPAANRIAYVTDVSPSNEDFLYVVNSDATGTTELSVPAGATSVAEIQWFSDGSRVLYSASAGADPELHVAPANGGNRIDLTPLPAGRGVATGARLSPDNALVAYAADADTANLDELFVVAPDGSGRTKISQDLSGQASGVVANSIQWASTGGLVLYIAPDAVTGAVQVFLVGPDGTNRVQLTQLAPAALEGYRISPDASQVFVGLQDTVGKIFSYSLDGNASVEVSDSTGGTDAASFAVADNVGITELVVVD